ncbi:hypothetical protein [Bacillus sp. FJAT-50079]|nr:hypothetical protein [Bacillus sp. FJAT-50079]MBS4206741.1 hypothetical protein [Bacillus sp. FJAT-50079]
MEDQKEKELLARALKDLYHKGHDENITLQQLIKDARVMLRPLLTKEN